ncbi:MAG: protein kinase [Planctomycetes bacterium]|nr:protein kinase [Planctomycetota bacterium]
MAKLVCQSGPSAGHEYPLTKDVTSLGRQSSCDVQIMDSVSSRVHCQVRRDGKFYTLVDLNSRNGTHLNGKKVTERQLTFGDHIRVGEVEWILVKESGDVELKDLLSKYEVGEKLGEGGMGVVYKVIQKSMARTVALKILSPKYASRQRFVDQFIREARAAGQLNHANIIQVHDVSSENGIHYFSMEYVDGPTCMQLLRANGAFTVSEALEIARQVARALEYAHEHRLIHQDIKPDNIMVGSNQTVKIADLGISKTFDEAESEEGPKRVMGTPHYMAPEAALGKRVDHRVDIYSLGATIYHLLTGKTPFAGTSATEVLKAAVMDPLPAIQDLNAAVPDEVCALVERLMAKKSEDRYQSATAVLEEIKRLQSGGKLGADRIPSNETMILQRLAKGASSAKVAGDPPGTAERPTPASTTGGKRFQEAMTTGSNPVGGISVETRVLRRVITLGIAAVLVFALILVLPRLMRNATAPPATQPGVDPLAAGGDPLAPSSAGDTPPSDQASAARAVAHAAALSGIESQLRAKGADADLPGLQRSLDHVLGDNPSPADRDRAEKLRARLRNELAGREKTQAEARFAALRSETAKLCEERNYDVALSRVAGSPDKANQAIAPRLGQLNDEITKARDGYLADLRARVQAFSAQKNASRLSELRDALPPPLLGSKLEQEIVAALAAIDREVQAKHQTVIKEVAADLARWDLQRVEDRHRSERRSLGESPSGKQFDAYLEAARKLAELITALDQAIKAAGDGKIRFLGDLQVWHNPDLIGADRNGIKLELSGATGEVQWKKIEPAQIPMIAELVLKDQAAGYQAALDALDGARAQAGK